MKSLLLITVFVSLNLYSQNLSLGIKLNDTVEESSGLVYLNGNLITHTDSDGEPKLYELDIKTGAILRTVEVVGVLNVDWEDIASDEAFIYIGDFGNNSGNRANLKIYKIKISDYYESLDGKVNAEVINFKYKDQVNFEPSPYDTNFDAETLINYKDKLYIFTKNWSDFNTNIYMVPKEPGIYDLEKIDQLTINGLISGGTYNPEADKIMLSGYTEDNAFLVSISNIEDDKFSQGYLERFELEIPIPNSYQVEGITAFGENGYLLSSESGVFGIGSLFEFTFDNTLNLEQSYSTIDSIFPNPAIDYIHLQIKDYVNAEIFNSDGKKVKSSNKVEIYIGDLPSGIYFVKAKTKYSDIIKSFKLIKE